MPFFQPHPRGLRALRSMAAKTEVAAPQQLLAAYGKLATFERTVGKLQKRLQMSPLLISGVVEGNFLALAGVSWRSLGAACPSSSARKWNGKVKRYEMMAPQTCLHSGCRWGEGLWSRVSTTQSHRFQTNRSPGPGTSINVRHSMRTLGRFIQRLDHSDPGVTAIRNSETSCPKSFGDRTSGSEICWKRPKQVQGL